MANSNGWDIVQLTMTGSPVALAVPGPSTTWGGTATMAICAGAASVLFMMYDDGVADNSVGVPIAAGEKFILQSTNLSNRTFYLDGAASTVTILYESQ